MEWAGIRVTIPTLSGYHGACTIWAETFFGAIAGNYFIGLWLYDNYHLFS